MRNLGYFLTAIGVAYLLLAMSMETSVLPSLRTNEYGMWDGQIPSRVENIGLIARRNNHLAVASLMTLIGVLLTIFGHRGGQSERIKADRDDDDEIRFFENGNLTNDEYRLWLADRYAISRNELFEAFVVQNRTFPDLDSALEHAHLLELANQKEHHAAAKQALDDYEEQQEHLERQKSKWRRSLRNSAIALVVVSIVGFAIYRLSPAWFGNEQASVPRTSIAEKRAENSRVGSSNIADESVGATLRTSQADGCVGNYAYLDTSGDEPTGLSVKVGQDSVDVMFSDYGTISGKKQRITHESIRFTEETSDNNSAMWTLKCSIDGAKLTIPADEYQAERRYDLIRSDSDIFEYALSKGYDIRHHMD